MSKKGISEVVSFVLILGLAVSLGTVISIWYQSTTKKQAEGLIMPIEGSSQCDEVNVNVAFEYAACSISVYNTGGLLVDSLKITYSDDSGRINITDYQVKIPPRLSQQIALPNEGVNPSSISTVSIVPIVTISKQPYYCTGNYMFQAKEAFENCGQ